MTVFRSGGTKGYSLVEVLVVIVIFAIITAGVSAVFLRGQHEYLVREETVRMQQQARLAMTAMERDLRMTGYGLSDVGNLKIRFYNKGVGTVTDNYYAVAEANVFGSPKVAVPAADTDSIAIRYCDQPSDAMPDITLSGSVPPPSSSNTPVSSTDGINANDLIIIYDPTDLAKYGSILMVTDTTSAGGLSVKHGNGAGDGPLASFYNPSNPAVNLFPPGGYPVGAKVLRLAPEALRTVRYYVDAGMNLRRQSQAGLTGAVEERPVASGIEDFQVKYYFRDGTWLDAPVTDDPDHDVDKLRAVRISIIVRTAKPDRQYGAGDSIRLTGDDGNGVARSGGGYRRMVMSTTISLRNLAVRDM